MENTEDTSDGSDAQTRSQRERLGDAVGSARQAFSTSFDRLTGREFRRQFEEFANVVTTTILGLHRDNDELKIRIDKIQSSKKELASRPSRPPEAANTGIERRTIVLHLLPVALSVGALILGAVAILRTF